MEKNLIVLHGWGSKIGKWKKFKKDMEGNGWTVYLPKLPGFGTAKLVRAWNLSDYAEWVAKFAAQRELKEYFLMGHSFGGQLAIKFASKNPKGLKKLILVNSAGIRNKVSLKKSFFLIIAKTGKIIFTIPPFCFLKQPARWLLYTFTREKDYYKADKIMKKTMKKILKADIKSCFCKIRIPVLIVWGGKDKDTPIEDAHLMNRHISSSHLIVYNDVGHGLPFKRTKKLVRDVVGFIEG